MTLRATFLHRAGRSLLLCGFAGSALLGAAGLVACDTNSSASTPSATVAAPVGGTQAVGGATGTQRGQAVFARYCNACHPGGGRGSGPALAGELSRLSDSDVTSLVRHGKQRMPAYTTDQISDPELVDLIAFVRTLK